MQTLAVDVSIWLTQFVKAMRDEQGQMLRNAHLLGTFRRVVKVRIACIASSSLVTFVR